MIITVSRSAHGTAGWVTRRVVRRGCRAVEIGPASRLGGAVVRRRLDRVVFGLPQRRVSMRDRFGQLMEAFAGNSASASVSACGPGFADSDAAAGAARSTRPAGDSDTAGTGRRGSGRRHRGHPRRAGRPGAGGIRGVRMLWALRNAELDVATPAAVASCRPTVARQKNPEARAISRSARCGSPPEGGPTQPRPASYQAEGPRLTIERRGWLHANCAVISFLRRAGVTGDSGGASGGLAVVRLRTILRSLGVHLLVGSKSFRLDIFGHN